MSPQPAPPAPAPASRPWPLPVLTLSGLAAPAHPVPRLPASIDVPADATVEDVKRLVARVAGMGDHNRVGLWDAATKKMLKDRRARVGGGGGEVLVKDLGPQVAWRTVFLVEYLGPLLVHGAAVAARPRAAGPLSPTQRLTFAMFMAHFAKRELETLLVHRFSASTMPFVNVFRNSLFYWTLAGLLCAWSVYGPRSLAACADAPLVDAVGAALWLFGETGNALVHLYLASLRSPGGTERRIPTGYGFGLVTCPNYMYEILAWVGVVITSRDWAVALFITVGAAQMYVWAHGKERAYRLEFGDRYKKKRFVLLPGLL